MRVINNHLSMAQYMALGQQSGDAEVHKAIGYLSMWGLSGDPIDRETRVSISANKMFDQWELHADIGERSFHLAAIWDERTKSFGFHS